MFEIALDALVAPLPVRCTEPDMSIADRYFDGADRPPCTRFARPQAEAIDRAAEACARVDRRRQARLQLWHGPRIAAGAGNVSAHRDDRRLSPDRREHDDLVSPCLGRHGRAAIPLHPRRRRLRQGDPAIASARSGRHDGALFAFRRERGHPRHRARRQGEGPDGDRRDLACRILPRALRAILRAKSSSRSPTS